MASATATVSPVLSVEQYVSLEERIDGAESDGVMARWEFGRALLSERVGKQLPKGRLADLVEATGATRRELQFRAAFAERFGTEDEVRTAVHTYRSWTAIREQALPAHAELPPPAPLPEVALGTYRTIVADPPWQYGNKATRAAAENHYPTMSIEELCALPVKEWAADQAHLYLWTTNGFLREAFDVLDAWGFEYKTTLVWVKPQIGLGNYFRSSTEYVLFATRGGLMTLDSNQRNWFEAKRSRHSKKPGYFFELLEQASPGPYLEMFARERRLSEKSWDYWGNEA